MQSRSVGAEDGANRCCCDPSKSDHCWNDQAATITSYLRCVLGLESKCLVFSMNLNSDIYNAAPRSNNNNTHLHTTAINTEFIWIFNSWSQPSTISPNDKYMCVWCCVQQREKMYNNTTWSGEEEWNVWWILIEIHARARQRGGSERDRTRWMTKCDRNVWERC